MNKLRILFLAAVLGSILSAQNITGTWQGTLKVSPQSLRIVIKISLEDDKLKAVTYSIDQGGQPVPASSITQDGSTIKFAVAAIGGNYEGKLSGDGNAITGTWNQGALAPLILTRATPETAWSIPEPLPPPKLMPADATPAFEVSTVKPSKPGERWSILVNRSGVLNTTNTTVDDLIKFAYDVHPRQIAQAPKWLEEERFDVTGKPDVAGLPNPTQLKVMMQKLLAERFQLSFHRERREMAVYAITVAKGGPKLTKSDLNQSLPGFGRGPQGWRVMNATIAEFAGVLQANVLDRPVVDQTGLGSARYNFTLNYTPDGPQPAAGGAEANVPAPAPNPDAPPEIYTAFQQQLGLKLESTRAPADVLVIDRVEKPSEN